MSTTPPGLTAQLATRVAELRFVDLSPLALERSIASIVDWVGCALEGSTTPEAAAARAVALAEGGGTPTAQVLGHALRVAPSAAALANGTAGHALDFDDSSPPMIGHPSTSLVPALLALAEADGASGAQFVTAYVAGLEAAARLGRHLNPSHYAAGWHATATLGTIGATTAAAKLLGLDVLRIRMALGIACSSAGGIRKNFGSGVKPLHAGFAARNGVMAARLAAAGMTADPDALEGERGFIDVFGGATPGDLTALRFGADQPLEIVASGIGIKPYACCGCTHSAVDAMLIMRERHRIDPARVTGIDCTMNGLVPDILVHHRPTTGNQAKFSMEYCLAVALLDGDCGTRQFKADRVSEPAVQALLRRVQTSVDPAIAYRNGVYPGTVRITLVDGTVYTEHAEEATGHPDRPMTRGQLARKFLACSTDVIGAERAQSAFEFLCRIHQCPDVGTLSRALAA